MHHPHRQIPRPEQVISLLAGAPIGALLAGGRRPRQVKPFATEREVASLLQLSRHQVRRIAKAWISGGLPAAKALKWGAGRPLKSKAFTPEETEHMVSRPTMYS